MGPGGPNMGHGGMGPGNNMGRGSPGMGHGNHNMGHGGPPGMGPGFGPEMGHNGPPELTNRGRSLLGAPPGLDSTGPPPPPPASHGPPQPAPPATHQLEQQISTLKASVKTLQEQIVQSESNLTAQWTVLQQNQRVQVEEAIHKAREAKLEELSRTTNISLSIMETVLQPIIESCTKDSISSGKSWIFQHSTNSDSNTLISEYLAWRVTNQSYSFNQKLHLIYLLNDVLHHCVRKNADALKAALEEVAVPMYCAAAEVAGEDEIGKLTKLITLWESKNKFFTENTIDAMKNPRNSMKKYRADLADEFSNSVEAVEKSISSTYGGYKQQHEQFVNHANSNMDQQQQQLDQLQHQLKEIEAKYEQELKAWQGSSHGMGSAQGASGRRSRWDRTAPSHSSGPPPGLPVPDLSRPPPGFIPPHPNLTGPGPGQSPKVENNSFNNQKEIRDPGKFVQGSKPNAEKKRKDFDCKKAVTELSEEERKANAVKESLTITIQTNTKGVAEVDQAGYAALYDPGCVNIDVAQCVEFITVSSEDLESLKTTHDKEYIEVTATKMEESSALMEVDDELPGPGPSVVVSEVDEVTTFSDKNTLNKTLTCNVCKKVFQRLKSYATHTSICMDEFSCFKCKKSFPSKKTLLQHVKRIHLTVNKCNLCTETFTTSKKLEKHRIKAHQTDQLIKCELCETAFKNKKSLSVHKAKKICSRRRKKQPSSESGLRLINKGDMNNMENIREKNLEAVIESGDIPIKESSNKQSRATIQDGPKETVIEKDDKQEEVAISLLKDSGCSKQLGNGEVSGNVKSTTMKKTYTCDKCNKIYTSTRGLRKHKATHRLLESANAVKIHEVLDSGEVFDIKSSGDKVDGIEGIDFFVLDVIDV